MKLTFVLALLLLGGCALNGDDEFRSYKSQSPTQMGAAIITRNAGFQDTAVSFSVLDPKRGAQPIEVGFVGDSGWQGTLPIDAVWSKDGTVVAVQGADFKAWSHAYDFKTSQIVEDSYAPFQGNIARLLKSRGGIGSRLLADWNRFDEVSQPGPATSAR